ncbi:hypothetical protein SAMN05444396_1112 [Flavobacterium segetis]|uniref:C-type lectin domain-containing protein n=1 Tax=Flavobacterium segetis TaxID=271157 RepID=A0A1M5JH52_9FLAO|nr:fibrinogen-like YCDxxxxGGGW domain-containing protein [Flavobacterium segetis]SHG39926.1 hypothetical protein SAMN05444396_1112 [Flavobacterium segetis]
MIRKSLNIVLIVLCFVSKGFSQATTVDVSGTNITLSINNNVQSTIDPQVTITADGNITSFTVTISGSYTLGDVLSYTGTLPSGVTAAAFNTNTRSLVFTGTTTASNWQTLLRTVTIKTVSATCYQEQRQVSFVAGNKYYNNLNGHFYENISGAINWPNALAAAATKSYFGRQGYLVTMTSLAETNFIWKIIQVDSWMGASDNDVYINAATGTTKYANAANAEGKWHWVSGPEKGTLFSVGNGSPVTQTDQFSYWNNNEPNDSAGEDAGQFYASSGGRWNDLSFSANLASYIVEYGGMSTDNVGSNVFFTRDLLLTGAPSGSIAGGNTTVCPTNSTTLNLVGLVSGGTVVKWQYSYDDFLTAGTDIANTTTTNTVTNITQNTYYRAVVNTPSCTGLNTSSTRIYVNNVVAGNIVADNNTICVNANVNFTLNGNSGNVTKWQVSTSSTFASAVTDIANSTTALSHQITAAGTYYFRAVIASCSSTVYTVAYTISCIAGTAPMGGTVSDQSFLGGSNSGTLTLSGYSGTISKWQYSTDGGIVWTDISNTATTYAFSSITSTRKYRVLLTSGTCGSAWSRIGQVSVINATVLTSNGRFELNLPNYIDLNGATGADTSLDKFGRVISIKPRSGLTFASAALSASAIKQAYPASTDGIYWISIPNINSGTPFQIYADMSTDGGGWMLLNVGAGYTPAPLASSVTSPNVLGYLPRATVIELANVSTDVQLRAGNSSTSYANKVTSTSPLAIGALKSSANDVNGEATWANGASSTFVVNSGTWQWAYCCPGAAAGWPKMYHSSNYTNGVHWFADIGGGRKDSDPRDAWFSTWIR